MNQLRHASLFLSLLVLPFAISHCDGPSSGTSDTIAETADAADGAETADTAAEIDTAAVPFACGQILECQPNQACASSGQGACMGPPPGPDGCGPNCAATLCGRNEGEVCLCASFECVDLGACTTCECIVALPGRGSCICGEADGRFTLNCPGA